MEKYLAGPISPRATSIASLCANLGLSMEWLLFGYSDNDRLRVRDHVLSAMVDLMHDLKEIGQLKEAFDGIEVGSKGFTTFALKLASDLAENVAEKVWESRKRTMREAAKGYKTAILEPVLFRAPSEQE